MRTPAWGDVSAEHAALVERHLLTPHVGEPRHIAATAVFLASDESAYVTGQIVRVDGGYLSHQPTTAELFGRGESGDH